MKKVLAKFDGCVRVIYDMTIDRADIEAVGDKVPSKSTWESAYRFMENVNRSIKHTVCKHVEPVELRCWMHD